MSTPQAKPGSGESARRWWHASHAAVCDVIEPWRCGTVMRASDYPNYWDFNGVRVEHDDGKLTVEALRDFADEALAGLGHRRINVEDPELAERLLPGFLDAGWVSSRLLFMRHEAPAPPGPEIAVEEVAYDAVHPLRVAWHMENLADAEADPSRYHAQAREVALKRGVQVLSVREDGAPIAFAQLEREGDVAEITQVYVRPDRRGGGRGTAMTRAAIEAAGDVGDLWICADDEDRPKELYARLGFRPAWAWREFTLLPQGT